MGKRASMTIAANIDAEQLRSLFHMPLAQVRARARAPPRLPGHGSLF